MTPSSPSSVNLSETRQASIYASSIIPLFFSTACVILRFWCRRTTKAGLWIDDWLVFAALLSDIGLTGITLWWIPRGLGKHAQVFGPNVLYYSAVGAFVSELTYAGVIVFVKLSILALYWRIFGGKPNIRRPIMTMATSVVAWGITVCIPLQGVWDKSIKAACNVDTEIAILITAIPNVILDFVLLLLPIPYVISLNLPKRQRTAIISIFLLGGFVCITSIVRLISIVPENILPDVSWTIIDRIIWSVVEAHFAIISACLPTMRPVWLAIRPKRFATVIRQSSYQCDLRAPPPRKRRVSLWNTSILRSNNNDEDNHRPFSPLDNAVAVDLGGSSTHEL
ncbi:hypothetical protein F5Y12DRAFT_710511 [Xylaria sp. FL1777]|nr:hypothetical protein F5Y12DRAFT_710511 [Xylaria sp. FL1777]